MRPVSSPAGARLARRGPRRVGVVASGGAVLGATGCSRGTGREQDRPVAAPDVAGRLLLDAAHAVIVPPASVM
ncbi:hypothetical protein [Kocuria sabuli]|uniref:hypothetical protein n=1 Tax=Kocuria sabuli TaxID=3071448 RepID=UPI0034D3F7FB